MTAAESDARFRELLTRWLDRRPGGWSGTAGDLWDELENWRGRKGWEYVPGRNALAGRLEAAADALAAAGWRLSFRRTAAARRIHLEPIR